MSLDSQIRKFAQLEREILSRSIPLISDFDRTQGYLDFKCTSIFEYLTEECLYSEGSAQRRIDAARLYADVRSLSEKLASGSISLNKVTIVCQGLRQTARELTATDKEKLLENIEGLNRRETEQVVAEYLDLPIIMKARDQVQRDGSRRLTVTLSKELSEKIERAQAKISHRVPTPDLIQFLDYACDLILDDKSNGQPSTATASVTPKLRDEVLREEDGCQYVYPDGSRCGSRWMNEVDHKTAKWAGGTNERENLQCLCAKHNREKYRREMNQRRR